MLIQNIRKPNLIQFYMNVPSTSLNQSTLFLSLSSSLHVVAVDDTLSSSFDTSSDECLSYHSFSTKGVRVREGANFHASSASSLTSRRHQCQAGVKTNKPASPMPGWCQGSHACRQNERAGACLWRSSEIAVTRFFS